MIRISKVTSAIQSVELSWSDEVAPETTQLDGALRPFALTAAPDGSVVMSFLDLGIIARWDPATELVRELQTTGGSSAYSGPVGLVFDTTGQLYIAESNHNVVSRWSQGHLETIAGTGEAGYDGDGGRADQARLCEPTGLACKGRLLFCSDLENHAVRVVDLINMSIETLVGTGSPGFSEAKQNIRSARLRFPGDIAASPRGLYITQPSDHAVRYVDLIDRTISTIGPELFGIDGQTIGLVSPTAVAVDAAGSVVIGDSEKSLVVVFDPIRNLVTRVVTIASSLQPFMSSISELGGGDLLVA